ncbi:MAG: SMC-Scp complex subunit ScpB [Hyphomicrobium sp.]|jgi:segregation and condensation protein B|uniref:SMC-Scp complex subunit ScpB n=2 Tax=Hyphomicrobium TaxID=81 RepID=UPI0025C73A59|nr:SMC-Scp complex subunit ScpB [Hyphomicrobium sp.]MBX9862571.1 SMC-Scp complex subunit ScpB [Hyphomicrobium sp.]
MVPPKLRLVSRDSLDDETERDAPEAQEALELARALSEADAVEQGRAPRAEERLEDLRIVEALLFASSAPLDEAWLQAQVRNGSDIRGLLDDIAAVYAQRGVNLVRVAGKWVFRTADDLGYLLERHAVEERRLSRAALETLAIIAYHQPVTRAEIEDIRGVTTSAGTLDILMEAGWIRPRGRRRAPGKPLTYGTTDSFLAHFGLDTVKDLPGLADLRAQGLLDGHLPPDFTVPDPSVAASLMPDELPLEEEPEDAGEDQAEFELDGDTEGDADGDREGAADGGLPEDDPADKPD